MYNNPHAGNEWVGNGYFASQARRMELYGSAGMYTLPLGSSTREAMEREDQKRKIREEILAKEGWRRALKEEVMRDAANVAFHENSPSALFQNKTGVDVGQPFLHHSMAGQRLLPCKSKTPLTSNESSNITDMYNKVGSRESTRNLDQEDKATNMTKLLKDIERLGSSTMTWKERKKLENKGVVALGGKPTKSHRIPLSVAKPMMKNKLKREQKKINEEKLLGIFCNHESSRKPAKRRPEDNVLKSSEGYFSKGVLNVKHLLECRRTAEEHRPSKRFGKHKKQGKGKGKGKRNGKNKERRKKR